MNALEFVDAVKKVVSGATRGIQDSLRVPPGRRPDSELQELSAWYNHLPEKDRERVAKVVQMAGDQVAYNILLILDGLVAIEDVGNKGTLTLIYAKDDKRTRLNDPDQDFLSDIFKNLEKH
ncbi:MAG: hypothetical protein AMXMBFR82_48100 [Candidatus Hydrogenedentota bacterium]